MNSFISNISTSINKNIFPIYEKILKDAHHTSAKYDRNISEFDVTGLETNYKDIFFAPFVKNKHLQLTMKYI